jgi:hypothetical protein
VRDKDAEEKERAGDADDREEEKEGLFRRRVGCFPDGLEVDQKTEADPEKKRYGLDHAGMIDKIRWPVNPVSGDSQGDESSYQDFLFDSNPTVN